MTFETTQQEAEHANKVISEHIAENTRFIEDSNIAIKEAKKKLRKLNKQLICEHDFKLRQSSPTFDNYKCKKCKFEFAVEVGLK